MARKSKQTSPKKTSRPSIPHLETEEAAPADKIESEKNPLKRFLLLLGPGFITGASDDDPSGLGTYAVTGARFGFAPLWLALLTFPLMTAIQFVSGKIGMVAGMGLSGVLREHYSRWILFPTVLGLLVANTINAGADIGAVSAAINLLIPKIPIVAMIVPITIIILVVQIWGSYRLIEKIFKWLALALIAYIGSALMAKPDWAEVARGSVYPDAASEW